MTGWFGTESNSRDSETLGNASFIMEIKEDTLTMGRRMSHFRL